MKIKNKLSIILVLLIASTTVFADIYVDGNGDVKIDETLTVTGETTSTGQINADGGIKVTGSATVSGETTSSGKINAEKGIAVTGNVTVSGDTTSEGIINANGGVEVNGNLNTDSLTVEGKLVVDSIEVRSTTGNTFGVGTFVNVANVIQKDWVEVWNDGGDDNISTVKNTFGTGRYRIKTKVWYAGGGFDRENIVELDIDTLGTSHLPPNYASGINYIEFVYSSDAFTATASGAYSIPRITKIEKWQDTTGSSAPSVPLDDGWEKVYDDWTNTQSVSMSQLSKSGVGRYFALLAKYSITSKHTSYQSEVMIDDLSITQHGYVSFNSGSSGDHMSLNWSSDEQKFICSYPNFVIKEIYKYKGAMTLDINHTNEHVTGTPEFTQEFLNTSGGDIDGSIYTPKNPVTGDRFLVSNTGSHDKGKHVINLPGNISLGPQQTIEYIWDGNNGVWRYDRGTLIDSYKNDNITVEKYAGGKLVCKIRGDITTTHAGLNYYGTSAGNCYYGIETVTFPHNFYNTDIYFSISGDGMSSRTTSHSTSGVQVIVVHDTNSFVLSYNLIAEGYWKDPQGE